ncbi:Tryptophan aminotransferase-related protein 2 [Frankliniella fusca]|uniref:Tryptophan aminotransferase-related protein 2 n=1 Tax=Frankliniella fusca TaxID=407009 RepID=A0AAE1I281_9NEOP|nr:Tryptophan aminotransferase-related protein 2 [Frankliniella fusca]
MTSETLVQLKQQGVLAQLEAAEHAEQDQDLAFLQQALRRAERDDALRLHEQDVRPGCGVGDNFSSVVTRNTVRGKRGNGSDYQRSVFVKRALAHDSFRCLAAFAKEAEAYAVVVPPLSRALGPGPGLPLPQCLHASCSEHPDHIVLEDLGGAGFCMAAKGRALDRAHATLALRALGRFHGASLALRRADPAAFRRLRAGAGTAELIFFPEAEAVFGASLRATAVLAVLSLERSGRADLGRRLAARAADAGVFREMCDAVLPPPDDGDVPGVFTHGDCWANNLLFRYNEDGRPSEAKLIDLAGMRYSSPALDLLHLLYSSVDRKVRTQHRAELLDAYLVALRGAGGLQHEHEHQHGHGLSRARLEREMRVRAPFGLWMGLWMLPAIFHSACVLDPPPAPADYFTQATQARLCAALSPDFHRRVLDLVEEYADSGLL